MIVLYNGTEWETRTLCRVIFFLEVFSCPFLPHCQCVNLRLPVSKYYCFVFLILKPILKLGEIICLCKRTKITCSKNIVYRIFWPFYIFRLFCPVFNSPKNMVLSLFKIIKKKHLCRWKFAH